MYVTYICTHTPTLSLHSVYTWYIHCIFNYYTWICIWYGMYIILFSGFRGTHRPPAPPSHGIEDNVPDSNDGPDFDSWFCTFWRFQWQQSSLSNAVKWQRPWLDTEISAFPANWGCYPTLQAMIHREDLHLRKAVRSQLNGYAYEILSICCIYTIHILTKIFWFTNYNIWICHVYVAYMLYIYWLTYFDILTKIF